jgi:uncharacterized membrane protein YhaH (DUF805 family)/Tol biopolymer transport system component
VNAYISAKGRTGRQTWWIASIILYVILFMLGFLQFSALASNNNSRISSLLLLILELVFVAAYIPVSVKRLHDLNKSGWYYLIALIPFIGSSILFVQLGFIKGTDGSNQYGDDPLNNSEFINPQNKLDNSITTNPNISKTEKVIIGILSIISIVLAIALSQNILRVLHPIPDNSIIVSGLRRSSVFPLFFNSTQYIFSLEKSEKTAGALPKNLGKEPDWSHDGRWIVSRVEERTNSTSESHIYIMRADGSQRTLVPIPHGGSQATWSPDGKQIAYHASQWEPGLFVANVECLLSGESCTPEIRKLINTPAGYEVFSFHDWSPDGKKIVYGDTKTNHISIISVDGQSQPIEIPVAIRQPEWSPDGTKIVGVCYYEGIANICVMNGNGSNLIRLTRQTTHTDIHYPKWSPDGQKIAYISRFSDKQMVGSCWDGCGYSTAIFIMYANGSGSTHLPFEEDFVVEWFSWYP